MTRKEIFKKEFKSLSEDVQIEIACRYFAEFEKDLEVYAMNTFDDMMYGESPTKISYYLMRGVFDIEEDYFKLVDGKLYSFTTTQVLELVDMYVDKIYEYEYLWDDYIHLDDYTD